MWVLGSSSSKPSPSAASHAAASHAAKWTCLLILIGCGLVSYWKVGETELLPVMNSSDISEAETDGIATASTFDYVPSEAEKVRT